MTVARAFTWGFVVAVAATIVLLAVGFIGQLDLDIPGVVGISSSSTGGPPQTSLTFNPLATVVLGIVLAGVVWVIGRLRARNVRP